MKIKLHSNGDLFRIMKLGAIQLTLAIAALTCAYAHETTGQEILDKRISISVNSASIKKVLSTIEEKVHAYFTYSPELMKKIGECSVAAENERLENVLKELLEPWGIQYKVYSNNIIVLTSPEADSSEFIESGEKLMPVKGTVKDEDTSEAIPGASVLIKNSTRGTTTDANGSFTIVAEKGDVLVISFIGFQTKEIIVESEEIIVGLKSQATSLTEVTVIGSRSDIPRTDVSRPTPVDLIPLKEMQSTGQVDIGQAIHYVAPSFNSSRQTIANGTDHIDPATLRGLGPDQVLVLINGKRRHTTALVNVNSTVGRGSVGTDMNSLPSGQIERIEILRDGAAAQYGSDAIAGVINIVLKKSTETGMISGQVGQTAEGDGQVAQGTINYGLGFKKGGFLNATLDFRHRTPTNRTGTYNGFVYVPTPGASATQDQIDAARAQDDSIVMARSFDRNGMIVGNSKSTNMGGFFNMGVPLGNGFEFYSFGGYNQRYGKAAGFYRYPNATRTRNLNIYPDGYLPFINTGIKDKSLLVGIERKMKDGWSMDLSSVYGGNSISFDISNSLNASMGDNSPTEFYAGTLVFNQSTSNINFSRGWDDLGVKFLNLAFGAEFRLDNYQINEGEEGSYLDGNPPGTPASQIKASGVQVFGGFRPTNAVDQNRTNIGVYADVESDLTEKLLVSGALRFENYSDFGGNLSGKIVGRYKFAEFLSLRAGYNRGFRAPSLHQQYYSAVSTQFITVNGVNQQREVTTVRNDEDITRALGLVELKPEISNSYSVGITSNIFEKLLISVDAYQIDIQDRIVISGRFSNTVPELAQYFAGTDITEAQFFTNAVDTKTQGIDAVTSYKVSLGEAHNLTLSAAMNLNKTEIPGGSEGVRTPTQLQGLGETLFNREERGRIEVNQPRSKFILSSNYKVKGLGFLVRATRFGEISTIAPVDPLQDQTFSAKWITDLQVSYTFFEKLTLAVGGNNIFNVYPDKVADPRLTNSNTVIYSRFATQFGFNGAYGYVNLSYRLERP